MLYIVKKTLKLIKNSNNDYVVALKKNNKRAYIECEAKYNSWNQVKDYVRTKDKGHGRIETRKYYVYKATELIKETFPGVKEVVKVIRERKTKEKTEYAKHYYISSIEAKAKQYANIIRGHWHIENRYHWVLDYVLGEDKTWIRRNSSLRVMTMIRAISILLLRDQNQRSCKELMDLISHNIERMRAIIE